MHQSLKSVAKQLLALMFVLSMFACIRHAEAIPPSRFVEVADLSNIVVSPDGESVAFRLEQASIERNTYDSVWYVQSMDGTTPARRVAEGGVPLRDTAGISLPTPAIWSPDGRWIYYRARIDGRIEVWRAAIDGSGAEPVMLDPADVRDFSLSADGTVLKYSAGATREDVFRAEQAEYYSGIRVDARTPIGQNLFRSGNIEDRLATQRLGPIWFERIPLLAETLDRWKVVDLATGIKRELAPSDVPSKSLTASDLPKNVTKPWKLAHDTRSGRIALLTRVGEKGELRDKPDVELAMLADRNAPQLIKCLAELCTNKAITDIQWRPGTDEVVFTVTDPHEGLAQSILRWNVKTGVVYPVAQSRGLMNGGRNPSSACGLASTALACVAAEADRPPRLERIDLESGEREALFDPNVALARDMEKAVAVRFLRWTDMKGREFTGQYFSARRASDDRPPLFVTYYTCPGFLRGGLGDEWPLVSLVEHGISALCINQLPGYTLDAIERHDQGRTAVESVVDLLVSEGEVDRNRVGMGGLSYGGAVTLWTVTESKLLAAASVSSPVVSPTYYLFGSLKGDSFVSGFKELWGLGTQEETPERWHALSPAFKLDKILIPILFQMSEQEYLHALDYTVPLMRESRADLYVFPHEPHQKFQPRHKLAVYERNLDWFRFWLRGFEDTDPSKTEQYKYWREMRVRLNEGTKAPSAP